LHLFGVAIPIINTCKDKVAPEKSLLVSE